MPALFDEGFFVREPAWHGMGIVLDDYPDRETAMRLAGHNWDVIERDLAIVGKPADDSAENLGGVGISIISVISARRIAT